MQKPLKQKVAETIMLLAAIYNLCLGIIISIYPQLLLFGNPPTNFLLIILRCVGMLVGVYGIAYWFASRNPQRYWPLILVGFIGKFLGPVGAVYYVYLGQLQPNFLWVNVWNDLIWLLPFAWVIYQATTHKLPEGTR
ncbi:hypothetical protein [Mucilaginibacter boryungensis]|nr:hypothetical protein [Mucilaginibacter boryungensis]